MLSRRSTEYNRVLVANAGENVFYDGGQSMFISIVMRPYPFTFQNSPKRFRDVEMREVRRKIEYMETPFFPSLKTVFYFAALVNSGVDKDYHCFFIDAEREVVHKFDESVGVYVFFGDKNMMYAVAVNHSEDIEVASSQAPRALDTLLRCFLIASLTASLSFGVLMMRLRPFPGLFFNPAMPSLWNLLTQCMTRWVVCPTLAPAPALLRPSALPNTIRHRIRNEWVVPFRYPFSKAALCSSVIFIFVACLDIFGEISMCKTHNV